MISRLPGEQTNRANERTPLANPGMAWHRLDIGVKDNGPECHGTVIEVGVILIVQRGSDAEVTEEYGTVIIDEEIRCFDIPVNKAVDMEITVDGRG